MIKPLLLFVSLLIWFGCQSAEPDPVVKGAAFARPLILSATIEGVGPAIIADSTIYVRLPSYYTASTFKLTYTGSAERITPAPGTLLAVNSPTPLTVCASSSKNGPCEEVYKIDVQRLKPFSVRPEQTQITATLAEPEQRMSLTFSVDSTHRVRGPARRDITLSLRNKVTQERITAYPNTLFYGDKIGGVAQERLLFDMPLPRSVKAGEYSVVLQSRLVFMHNNGALTQDMPIETIELPTTVTLYPGIPYVGNISLNVIGSEITVKGGYLRKDKPVQLLIESDFVKPIRLNATVLTDSTAVLTLPVQLPAGQYAITATPVDGSKPMSTLVQWTKATEPPYVVYYAVTSTQFKFPVGGVVSTIRTKPGEKLIMMLGGKDYSWGGSSQKQPYAVQLLSLTKPGTTYGLTNGTNAPGFAVAGIRGWQYTIPTNVPKGDYQLVFDLAENGPRSLPFYRKVVVE